MHTKYFCYQKTYSVPLTVFFRGKFKNYFNSKSILLNKVSLINCDKVSKTFSNLNNNIIKKLSEYYNELGT